MVQVLVLAPDLVPVLVLASDLVPVLVLAPDLASGNKRFPEEPGAKSRTSRLELTHY